MVRTVHGTNIHLTDVNFLRRAVNVASAENYIIRDFRGS